MERGKTRFQTQSWGGPYICSWCRSGFSRIDHLRRHERAHENRRNHECDICGKAFNRRDVLERHRSQMHGGESPPSSSARIKPHDRTWARNAIRDSDGLQRGTQSRSRRARSRQDFYSPNNRLSVRHTEQWLDPNLLDASRRRPSLISSDFSDSDNDSDDGSDPEFLYSKLSSQTEENRNHHDRQDIDVCETYATTAQIQRTRAMVLLQNPGCTIGDMLDVSNHDLSANFQNDTREESNFPDPVLVVSMNHRLNVIEKESLFAAYRKNFLVPIIHFGSTDFQAAFCERFATAEAFELTRNNNVRPFPKALFYSILAHGAAYVKQPDLARKLHASVNRMLLNDFSMLVHRQTKRAPLYIVQTILHQAIFGLSFGEPSLESNCESHMRSLVELFRDPEARHELMGLGTEISKHHVKSRADWLHWTQQEESRRTAYAVFWFLNACILRLNQAPMMPLSEVESSLPSNEELWETSCLEDFQVSHQNDYTLPGFQKLYASIFESRILPSSFDNSSPYLMGITDDAMSTNINILAEEGEIGPLSEFQFLILAAAFHNETWNWNAKDRLWNSVFEKDAQARLLQSALYRLRRLCPNLEDLTPGSGRYRFLVNAVNMLDHVQLMLRIDLVDMKEALLLRQFESLNWKPISSVATTEISDEAQSEFVDFEDSWIAPNQGPVAEAYMFQTKLDAAAVFSARALVQSTKTGKWWSSQGAWDLHLPSAMMAFNFIQTLIRWALVKQGEVGSRLNMSTDPETLTRYKRIHVELLQLWDHCSFINTSPVPFESPRSFMRLLLVISNSYAAFFRRQCTWPVLEQLAQGLDVRVHYLSQKYFSSVS